MNKNTSKIDAKTHATVQDLLPWYVVNALQSDENQLVQAHLANCPTCREDLQWQLSLRAKEPVTDTKPDVEHAFARLLPQLEIQPQSIKANYQSSLARRLQSFFSGEKKMGQMTMRWVMAGQTAIIVGLVLHLILPGQHENSFRVLSSSEQLAPGNIVVVFKPETSVKDIQRIMSHNDARIVDGPTVTNAYVLRVSNDQLTQSVTDLRTEPMIELVESLGSGGGK